MAWNRNAQTGVIILLVVIIAAAAGLILVSVQTGKLPPGGKATQQAGGSGDQNCCVCSFDCKKPDATGGYTILQKGPYKIDTTCQSGTSGDQGCLTYCTSKADNVAALAGLRKGSCTATTSTCSGSLPCTDETAPPVQKKCKCKWECLQLGAYVAQEREISKCGPDGQNCASYCQNPPTTPVNRACRIYSQTANSVYSGANC